MTPCEWIVVPYDGWNLSLGNGRSALFDDGSIEFYKKLVTIAHSHNGEIATLMRRLNEAIALIREAQDQTIYDKAKEFIEGLEK